MSACSPVRIEKDQEWTMSYNFVETVRYCPHCGKPVGEREAGGRLRPYCAACQITFFADPKIAAGVLVVSEGKVLLQRRAIDPGRGRWSFPSGYVERGERVEDAAVREVWEETGLHVRLTHLLGLYSQRNNLVILAVYVGEPTGGTLTTCDENDAVEFFAPSELPVLAFPHDEPIIAACRAGAGTPIDPAPVQRGRAGA